MKKIKVIVKDKNTLILDQDASKGDYIDLNEFMEVDASEIENKINAKKDVIYEKRMNDYKSIIKLENTKIIDDLNNEIKGLKEKQEVLLKEKENEIEKKYFNKVHELMIEINNLKSSKENELTKINSEHALKLNEINNKYETLNNNFDTKLSNEVLKIKNEYETKIIELNNKIDNLNKDSVYKLKEKENELNNIKLNELNKQKDEYEERLKEKDAKINEIVRQRASLNVKQTGEDLEAWCNNEVVSYMQNGLFNCTWIKDNEVIKDEGEIKGSKADYIFRVYASSEHLDNELLTSVCMDMKDENPDSINKKTNADYYKQLDKNRNKKNCKYAVLVSNLEMDKSNDLPMFRVSEYKDMYVVRPAYLMIFLNMITSLTTRFADLVLADKQEKINLKNSLDLIRDFETLKNTYLDKPLESLEKSVNEILKQSEGIRSASNKISESCEKIISSYINQIQDKLSRFEIKIEKEYKKFSKGEIIEE